jgi:hypothetical protein
MYASIVRNCQLVHVACTHMHFTNYHLMQETLKSHDCWEPGNEMEGKVTSSNINRLLHFQLNIIHTSWMPVRCYDCFLLCNIYQYNLCKLIGKKKIPKYSKNYDESISHRSVFT